MDRGYSQNDRSNGVMARAHVRPLPNQIPRCRLAGDAFDAGAQRTQLEIEVVVAALDMLDAPDARGPVGAERRQQIRGACADIGHRQISALQRRRPPDDAAVEEVLLAEATLQLAEALLIQTRVRAHAVKLVGV